MMEDLELEDVEDVENFSTSDSQNEIPQAESATISSGVPMFNDCRVCDLMSFFKQKIIRDESELEKFMLDSLPELHFVGAVGKHGKLVPLKQTAKTLTFLFLESFFCYYHDNSVSIGNCHGSKFQNCMANLAIKRKVLEVFPNNADAKFAMDVQSWFTNKTNSLAVSRSGAHRAPTCTICFERSRNKKIVRADSEELGRILERCYPENPREVREMVDVFLTNFILLEKKTGTLTLTKNCFGENFRTCEVMLKILEKGYSLFSSDVCQALNFAQDWFKNQLTSFEEIKSIATGPPKLDTSNAIHINLPEKCKKDEVTMIGSYVDYIFEKRYVGFVQSCGMSKKIPRCLDDEIYRNVLEEFPKLKRNIYEDYVKEWFQSKE